MMLPWQHHSCYHDDSASQYERHYISDREESDGTIPGGMRGREGGRDKRGRRGRGREEVEMEG